MKTLLEFLVKGNICKNKEYDIYSLENTNNKYIEITDLKDFSEVIATSKYNMPDKIMKMAESLLLKNIKIYLRPGYNEYNEKVIKLNHVPTSKSFKFTFDNKKITLDEFTTEYWEKNNWVLW